MVSSPSICTLSDDNIYGFELVTIENIAIAMHSNLRPPAAALISRSPFNWDACAKFEVGQDVCCYFVAFYTLRYAVTLTFDLEHL